MSAIEEIHYNYKTHLITEAELCLRWCELKPKLHLWCWISGGCVTDPTHDFTLQLQSDKLKQDSLCQVFTAISEYVIRLVLQWQLWQHYSVIGGKIFKTMQYIKDSEHSPLYSHSYYQTSDFSAQRIVYSLLSIPIPYHCMSHLYSVYDYDAGERLL